MTDLEPRYVGVYALRERVGVSLSGDTFRALDGAFSEEVAVKVLSSAVAGNRELLRALETKARAVAPLNHSNVAPLLDYESTDRGYFLVTGLIHGRSLDRIVREDGPLSVIQAVDTAAEVAAALHAGHSIGLAHGSLRLTKIMHTVWGETRLTGFGVVPVAGLHENGALRTDYVAYYPPERRSAPTPDVASDTYSLGVVLLELLTGEPASRSSEGAVAAPSHRNSEVSPELDTIVAKALAPDPKSRFRDCFEFEEALRAHHKEHLERLVWRTGSAPKSPLPTRDAGPLPPTPQLSLGAPTAGGTGAGAGPTEEALDEAEPAGAGKDQMATGSKAAGARARRVVAAVVPGAAPEVPETIELRDAEPVDGTRAAATNVPVPVAARGPLQTPQAASKSSGHTSRDQVIELDPGAGDEGAPTETAGPLRLEPKRRRAPSASGVSRSRPHAGASARWAALISVLVLAAGLADFAYSSITVVSSLGDARGALNGVAQLRGGRYNQARQTFSDATDASERALAAAGHPSYRLASVLPWLRRDPQALRNLAEGSRLSATAGLAATDAVVAMGAPKSGPAAAIYRKGKVRFNALENGAPLLGNAHDLLDQAALALAEAPEANIGPIRSMVSDATERIEGARDTAAKVETLTEVLPSLLGQDDARRYLLAFQSPSLSRGTGGAVALYGILQAVDGRIEFEGAESVDLLGDVSADSTTAPDWFAAEYGRFGAFEDLGRAGFSPSFSVVAPLLAELYESANSVPVDGVVAMDPTALGRLTRVTGPIRRPGYGATLNAESTMQVLNHDVYLHFAGRDTERDDYVASVIEEFWRRVSKPSARVSALPSSLAEVITSGHFKLYSRLGNDQRALVDLDANGDYRPYGASVQTVFHNNLAKNKVDYFLERRIATSIELRASGDASVTTKTVMTNNAVAGPSTDFLGPGDHPSVNHMRLSFLLPRGARVERYVRDGNEVAYETGGEGQYPMISENIQIPAGDTVGTTVDYAMRTSSFEANEGGTFRFTMFPQATVNPNRLSLHVEPPDGYSITTPDGPGDLAADGSFSYSGTATGPLTIELQVVRD